MTTNEATELAYLRAAVAFLEARLAMAGVDIARLEAQVDLHTRAGRYGDVR